MDYNSQDGIRKLPYSVSAEHALLGSLLIDPSQLTYITALVKPGDFFIKEHGQIYEAMLTVAAASHDIDTVTLMDLLEKSRIYDTRESAEAYLRLLTESVPSALNIQDYARIVLEKSALRQIITLCGNVSEKAYSESEKPESVIAFAEGELANIAAGRDTHNFQLLTQVISEVYERLQKLAVDPDAFEGIKTGFSEVDRILGGINTSDLVLIGARPAMGKTSFALNIATNVALSTGKKVAVFSLEMSAEQLATRILSSDALVESPSLRTGKLSETDWARLAESVNRLSGARILIDDSSNVTVSAIKAKVRREKDIGMIIVDYLGLMQGERHTDNRVLEIGDITRGLKLLAKDMNVPVVCVSQLSRGVESRNSSNRRPMLSDLRDSGSIEQDADSVIFIYRDDYYKTGDKKDQDAAEASDAAPVAEIIVAKNRHGSTGTAKLNWIGKYTVFRSVERGLTDADAPPEYKKHAAT